MFGTSLCFAVPCVDFTTDSSSDDVLFALKLVPALLSAVRTLPCNWLLLRRAGSRWHLTSTVFVVLSVALD